MVTGMEALKKIAPEEWKRKYDRLLGEILSTLDGALWRTSKAFGIANIADKEIAKEIWRIHSSLLDLIEKVKDKKEAVLNG